MPSISIARLLVVTTGLCSALAGKAIAQSIDPPMGDPNHQETLRQYLDTVPEVGWGKRNSTLRAVQLIWQDGGNIFDIAMDSCEPKDTIAGIYQFANGTSKNDATIYEISQDLLQFASSKHDGHRLERFASQAIANAQLGVNDIIAFLDNHVLCGGSDHNELRRLLVYPDNLADGYWVAIVMKGVVGSAVTGLNIAVTRVNATFIDYAAGTVFPFYGLILNGLIDRAQKTGGLTWLGAFLGAVVSARIRTLMGMVGVSVCNDGPPLTNPGSAMSAIHSGQCPP